MLAGQHAHRVLIHRALDRPLRGFVDRSPQLDPGDLRNEKRMKRCDNGVHAAPPGLDGGITAAPMHPTIAPHQIDVMKSKRLCRLAASGSWTDFIASRPASVPAAGRLRPSPTHGRKTATTVFMVRLLLPQDD